MGVFSSIRNLFGGKKDSSKKNAAQPKKPERKVENEEQCVGFWEMDENEALYRFSVSQQRR